MDDFEEEIFYILEINEEDNIDCVRWYRARLDYYEARDTFMCGLQEGFSNRKLVLGADVAGLKTPFFQCDQGLFSIPDECNHNELPEAAKALLSQLMQLCGMSGHKFIQAIKSYDICITEKLCKKISLKAENMEQALSEAGYNYKKEMPDYVLEADTLQEVTFSIAGISGMIGVEPLNG